MERFRRFRLLLPVLALITALLVILPGLLTPAFSQQARSEIRGVWITTNDMATIRDRTRMRETMAQLRQFNFNTIYPVMWNSGYAIYPSGITQRKQIQSFTYRGLDGQDFIGELIAEAHSQGMLAIPWFEFGFMAPPFSELATKHPDWLTQKRDGTRTSISAAGEVVWLNPFRPEVQKFITDLVLEIVNQYDADGIQFDDHMSLPSEFGYDPFTLALYTRTTGRPAPASAQDPAWVKWRADRITAFMAQLHQAVRAKKPKAIVSISPNYYDFAYKLQLQDWLTWVRRGLVDELLVQVYRPDVDSFVPLLNRAEMEETRKKIPTAIGIMTGLRTKPAPIELIQAQVQEARARGLGVAFFYLESLWKSTQESADIRQSGFQALFPSPAPRPRL